MVCCEVFSGSLHYFEWICKYEGIKERLIFVLKLVETIYKSGESSRLYFAFYSVCLFLVIMRQSFKLPFKL